MFSVNDTHPTVTVAELMRILMDEKGLSWDEAWGVTTNAVLTLTIQSWLKHLKSGLLTFSEITSKNLSDYRRNQQKICK